MLPPSQLEAPSRASAPWDLAGGRPQKLEAEKVFRIQPPAIQTQGNPRDASSPLPLIFSVFLNWFSAIELVGKPEHNVISNDM